MAALKCRYCGNNLSLEDVYCPFCGKKNEEAKKHASDMRRYQREFEETREEVYTTTKTYGVLYARIILMVILAAGIIASLVIASNSYSFRRARLERDAARNIEKYSQEMDQLLAEEDYLKFSEFCNFKEISSYTDGYEKYEYIISAASQFEYIYASLAEITYSGENHTLNYVIESLGDNLDYFYEYTSEERLERDYRQEYDAELTKQAFAGMEAQTAQLLKTYLGLSDEEAEEFRGMTKARRSLVIEEHVTQIRGE